MSDQCELGLNLVREITSSGLLLHDIRGPNFILTDQAVVRIDFQPMTIISETYDLDHVADMRELEFFNAMLDHFEEKSCKKLLEWAKKKFPKSAHIWD